MLPVLWLCGPAGVGKSTVAWQLFTEVADTGVPVVFADTDQLGMCYPAASAEPGRQRIKLANISAMIPNYRAAGARCAIINGVIDPVAGLPANVLPDSELTICRLRADPDEVERRFLTRDGQSDDAAERLSEVRDEITGFDKSSFADACVDTTGVRQSDVAALVRDACKDWPGFSAGLVAAPPQASELDGTGVDGEVMLIAGPTGVGKSTVGFGVYVNCVNGGRSAGYVDLEQIGFIRSVPGDALARHRLRARNLAAIWRNYRGTGATHLVATGPIEDLAAFGVYARELPAASITLVRLHAGPEALSQRITSRGAGGGWSQPGDPLVGQPAEVLRAVAARAARDAAALDHSGPGGVTIETDGLTAEEAADLIARAAGQGAWLPGGSRSSSSSQ